MSINIPKRPSLGKTIKDVGTGFISKTWARLKGAGLDDNSRIQQATAKWSGRTATRDWRVKLTLPSHSIHKHLLDDNEIMKPLQASNGVFWPVTPAVIVQNSANYNALAQTHSNYPFQAYQNSQVDTISIVGEFPVQNSDDAKHWIATVKFLRTMSKMAFGQSKDKGQPPPIMHLSGYGDHMFDKVPVIVQSFNVELRNDHDYISTKQGPAKRQMHPTEGVIEESVDQTWAPTLSTISVGVIPVYSRESLTKFSLQDFARGNMRGKEQIGFI